MTLYPEVFGWKEYWNHRYNLKGELCAAYKGKIEVIKNGYRFIRVKDHPFSNDQGFIREHRLVAEKYLLTKENSVKINGKRYLKPEYDVHHIDENKLNNDKDNLMVLTKSEHRVLHNKKLINRLKRNRKTGRFMKLNY